MNGKIRVLVVEDSPVVQMLLVHVLGRDPEIEVAGTCADGIAAVRDAAAKRPDVILMDVNLPGLDGFQATRQIMEAAPVPIVMCSSAMKREEAGTLFRAIEAGAVSFVNKPPGPADPAFAVKTRELVETVKSVAGFRAFRRIAGAHDKQSQPAAATNSERPVHRLRVVAIGASTGGPQALRELLAALPAEFPLPVVIVQHIADGFIPGLVDWLGRDCALRVGVAADGQALLPGQVYLAPDGHHVTVSNYFRLTLDTEPQENGLRPAVARLFRSLLPVHATGTAAVLLSGMGRDGAEELKLLRDAGAVTFAQDRESCVVHGMAGAAVALGAARHILPPARIAATLSLLTKAA